MPSVERPWFPLEDAVSGSRQQSILCFVQFHLSTAHLRITSQQRHLELYEVSLCNSWFQTSK